MSTRISGEAVVMAVLLSLLSVVDIASRIMAPLLSRVRASRVFSALAALTARLSYAGAASWMILWFIVRDQTGAVLQRGSFGDLLDPRFREVIADRSAFLRNEDMVPVIWNIKPPTMPMRDTERYSQLSGLPRAGQFTGSLDYAQAYQGYDVTATYVEFAQGVQIERTLVEYDQFDQMDDMARALADSMWRRRQFDAFRFLRNMFNVDTFFYNHTEGGRKETWN